MQGAYLGMQTPHDMKLEDTWNIYVFLNEHYSFPLSVKLGDSVPQTPKILYPENLKHQENSEVFG